MPPNIEICFWLYLATIAYTYAGHPLTWALAASQTGQTKGRFGGSVSILVPAYEEPNMARRVEEFSNTGPRRLGRRNHYWHKAAYHKAEAAHKRYNKRMAQPNLREGTGLADTPSQASSSDVKQP